MPWVMDDVNIHAWQSIGKIMSINVGNATQQSTTVAKSREVAPSTVSATDNAAQSPQDKVTLSDPQQEPPVTYADPRGNVSTPPADLQSILEESDRKAQAIVDLIRPLIEQQGLDFAKVASGEQKLNIDPATIEKAKAAISEDGEFGVRKTAERILSFAKGVIGGDPAKLDAVRAAVEKGFDDAQEILGGSLPEISQQTRKAIQAEFDRWQTEGIPTGDTVSLAKAQKPSDA
jgi:hypothetical protein